jgi:hypothetical protein
VSKSFVTDQRASQAAHFRNNFAEAIGYRGADYRLMPDQRNLNLDATIRSKAERFFAAEPSIQWHTHANHGLSSQVCCVNFLMPLADKPEMLARWVGHNLGIAPPQMLVVEPNRAGQDWLLTFEWIGETDYLNEADSNGNRGRGANATAADAAVKFQTPDGKIHLVLIEWKYTESYGAPLSGDPTGKRIKRYSDIAFSPAGPMRGDLDLTLTDFFWEPFYQLLRQQMLAWHIENDPDSGIDRARVLHISPSANSALHKVTSPVLRKFGDDAFEVFRSLLTDQAAFVGVTIEDAFAPLASWPEANWYPALRERYSSLCHLSDGDKG